ncbi:MAG: hypothetical protein N2V78_07730 [Methanophagales archaeon]|nr:hypothetical protein [Methanophagales archaeon]
MTHYKGETISAIARSLSTNRHKVDRTIDKVLAFGVKVALEVNFLAEKDTKEKVYINMAHI